MPPDDPEMIPLSLDIHVVTRCEQTCHSYQRAGCCKVMYALRAEVQADR